MRVLAPGVANLLLLLAAIGLGGLLRPLLPKSFSKLDRLTTIAVGGIGFLGLLLFLIGLVRFSTATILTVLIPGGAFGIWCLRQELRGVRFRSLVDGVSFTAAGVIAAVLLVTVIGGFTEMVGDITEDSILYHYLGPHIWVQEGVIRPVLDSGFTAFPATVEVQYGAVMALGGRSGPELFAAIALCLFLLVAVTTALRMGLDRRGAWWVAALLSAMPAVYRGIYGGMIDAVYASFVLVAARILFDDEQPGHAVLVGLFCGFAMGTKYSGLVASSLQILSAALLAPDFRALINKKFFGRLAIMAGVAVVVAAPWYIRNWVVLGSPIYPPPLLLSNIFHSPYFPVEAVGQLHKIMAKAGGGMGRQPLNLLLLPFHFTFHPANFEAGAGGIGLVPLTFIPFCLGAYAWGRFAKKMALFAALQTVFWFFTMQESRYIVQVYLVLAIFGVAGWQYALGVLPRFGRLLCAVSVAVSIGYGGVMIWRARGGNVRAAISPRFEEQRKLREIPALESFRYLNGEPSVGSVLVLNVEVPTYFLDKPYVKPFGRYGERSLLGINTASDVMSRASELHITHVLDAVTKYSGFCVPPEEAQKLELILDRPDQRVYRVVTPTEPTTRSSSEVK